MDKIIYTSLYLLLIIITLYIVNKIFKFYNVTETFVADAHSNGIILMDENYRAFDNFYDPLKLLYDKPIFKESNANDDGKTFDQFGKVFPIKDEESVIYNSKVNINNNQGVLLSTKQPHIYDKLDIIKGRYYYDARFPQEPVPLEFGLNADKFCQSNVAVYPCYKYYSRWD